MYALVGYADIKYRSTGLKEADLCIVALHKDGSSISLKYYFNGEAQDGNCRLYTDSYKDDVA